MCGLCLEEIPWCDVMSGENSPLGLLNELRELLMDLKIIEEEPGFGVTYVFREVMNHCSWCKKEEILKSQNKF